MPASLQRGVRIVQLLWQRFNRHQGLLRASALAFDTSLVLVPLLALAFVILKLAGLQELLAPFVLQQLTGNSQETASRMLHYIENVKVGGLGIFGILALLASLFFLLENVRDAFNAVWEEPEQRSVLRRFLDYLVLMGATPVLLSVTFVLTTLLQSQYLFQWLLARTSIGIGQLLFLKLTPFLCMSLVLVLAYLLLPVARIRFSSALVGGLITGAFWQAAHWVYFQFQFGVSRYSAMYGTLAAVPLLLIWMYTSWLLVLIGLELVRCHQQGVLLSDAMQPKLPEN